jgi:hypothetical protein
MPKNLLDLTGQRFSYLIVLRRSGQNKKREAIWECLCDCGNLTYQLKHQLTQGRSTSCGCYKKKRLFKDLTNQKFGKLTALELIGKQSKEGCHIWKCICDCGNIKEIPSTSLTSLNTKSCGCLRPPHGKSYTKVYRIWHLMVDRCKNPNIPIYEHYGARGIQVCERWLDFRNFYEDMGDPPEELTLDRIDVNGNYEPSNCRWATWHEQANNRRNNIHITYEGVTQTLTQWAKELNIPYYIIHNRHRAGWSIERIISTPYVKRAS